MPNQFYNGQEIAKILKISKALAYRLMAEGKIRSVRFGRTVRVTEQDLHDFIQSCASPKFQKPKEVTHHLTTGEVDE